MIITLNPDMISVCVVQELMEMISVLMAVWEADPDQDAETEGVCNW